MYYLIYKMGAVLEYINIYTIYSQISLIYNLGPGDQLRLSGIIAEVGADFFSGCIHWSAGAHEKHDKRSNWLDLHSYLWPFISYNWL